MRNLARLTYAANLLEHGANTRDRRKYPKCARSGCRRRVSIYPDGKFTRRCYLHRDPEEAQEYADAWRAENTRQSSN